MDIEWDENKRNATLDKHGVDFADFRLMQWETALSEQDNRNTYSEPRFITIGFIKTRLHVAVWCYRNTNMRIISFRKANPREAKKYERQITD